MVGLVKRPVAPGGGLRDRRGLKEGSWTGGKSRRALGVADECMMLVCFSSVSSFHPAPPPTTCTKTATHGVGTVLLVSQLRGNSGVNVRTSTSRIELRTAG